MQNYTHQAVLYHLYVCFLVCWVVYYSFVIHIYLNNFINDPVKLVNVNYQYKSALFWRSSHLA